MAQIWVTSSLGGYLTNNRLSRQIRTVVQPLMKFRQFVEIKEAMGKGKGDTVYFEKLGNVQTQGGTLTETSTMPSTYIIIATDSMKVNEYGNSVPFTGKLEALSEFSINNITTKALRNDQAKVLDSAAADQFAASDMKYVCHGTAAYSLTSNGTNSNTAGSSGSGHGNLNAYHVKNIVDKLRIMNIPKFDGQNYVCIASITAMRGLKDDNAWINPQLYHKTQRLFTGEIGKLYGCRFVEETDFLSTTLGNGSVFGEAIFFGADAVAEAVAIPPEIRAKVPTDFGRSKGVAWYGILGFKKMWDYSTDSESHIIHCTSAA